jgi:hypothetical protein
MMVVKQSGPNEQVIRQWFESRGWSVTKLPSGKSGKSADFRICSNDDCFLCEVKTIESVLANFPYTAIEYYHEQRQRLREQIEVWLQEPSGRNLVLRKDEWKFIYGDEVEFQKKYQYTRRNTLHSFQEFAETMRMHFAASAIRDLPYLVRLDSDDLYRPTLEEQVAFISWLEREIQAIDRGEPGRCWQFQEWSEGVGFYSAFYPIHQPKHRNDTKAEYQLSVLGPGEAGPLEVDIHCYGALNLDSITSNLNKALKQLESSALQETDQQIPRTIMLGFKSNIGLEWDQLSMCITDYLQEHPNLSAIAILGWTPDGTPPPQEKGPLARIEFWVRTPAVPSFVVYHNSRLQAVKPLPTDVFNDRWSVQLCTVR